MRRFARIALGLGGPILSGLRIAFGKKLTVNNTMALSASSDNAILNIGSGGTLGSNAFSSAIFEPQDQNLDALASVNFAAFGTATGLFASTSTFVPLAALVTITGTANQIAVTNGDGAAGNPTIALGNPLTVPGKIGNYNGIATDGWGVAVIQKAARLTARTAAVSSVAAYTLPAADGSYEVSMNVLITTSTLHAFTCECAYTDEGNTARVVTLQFSNLAGTFVTSIANAAGAVPYEGVSLHIRCKASTTITLRTQAAGTYTTVTYNVEGIIRQLA
jgi:hypothetical protein